MFKPDHSNNFPRTNNGHISTEGVGMIGNIIPSPVFIYSLQGGTLLYVNEKFILALGRSMDEPVEMNHNNSLVFKDDKAEFERGISICSSLAQNAVHTYPCRLNRKPSGHIHFQLTGKVLERNIEGKAETILFIAQDISQQVSQAAEAKELERSILNSASLETGARRIPYVQGIIHDVTLFKRTEEIRLQTERLEAKSQVIRTLAHEIRNPLNNISVSIDQIKSTTNGDCGELLNIVRRGVNRIDTLISKLMDSAQYLKMSFEVLPLQAAIDQALEGAMDRLVLKKIKLELSYPPSAALALIDMEKIKVAFLNILVNAVEAMEANQGVLQITVRSTQGMHVVRIKDNGCGMSEESLARLYEPYYTTKPNGVGIGLSSTSHIMEAHKGSISVTSVPSQGTEFSFTFPAL